MKPILIAVAGALMLSATEVHAATIEITLEAMTETHFTAQLARQYGDLPKGAELQGVVLPAETGAVLCVKSVNTDAYTMLPQPNDCHATGNLPVTIAAEGTIEVFNNDPSHRFSLKVLQKYERDFGFLALGDCNIRYPDGQSVNVSQHDLTDMLNGWMAPPVPSGSQIECRTK